LIWLQANFDRLSDLPHRALFFDRLSQACSTARRNGKQLALLLADLYAFQPVTRQYGHDGGGEWAIIVAPMATSISPTYGQSNSPMGDARIMTTQRSWRCVQRLL
jgi:predicted signal transduction protein with EAL and GGDEF domain